MRAVATDGVAWSVSVLITAVSPENKAAKPIEMPLAEQTRVGLRNHVLIVDGARGYSNGTGHLGRSVHNTPLEQYGRVHSLRPPDVTNRTQQGH